MNAIRLGTASALLAGTLLLSPVCEATNGYFPHGWGTRSGAMAGAGAALAEDAMAAATNPAAIAALPDDQFTVGLSVIHAEPGYRASAYAPPAEPPPAGSFPLQPGRVDADPDVPGDVFLVPQAAAAWRLNARSAVGVAVYANGGLNATYKAFDNPGCPAGTDARGTYCGGGASNDLAQLFIAPTYAAQLGDRVRLGASLLLAYQAIEVRGLSAFAPLSSDPDHLTNRHHEASYGYGIKLGLQARLAPTLDAALVVQSRVRMSRLKAYEGLFAEHGGFDVPPYATVGLAWTATPSLTAAFDVQRIAYSRVRTLGNDFDSPGRLGDRNGPGFGWRDINVYKLGVRYTADPHWTLRAGYSRNQQPLDKHQLFFAPLAGSVLTEHYTAGFTYRHASGNEFDMSLMYAPENHLRGANPLYPDQTLDVSLKGLIVDFAWRGLF
ncbi:MAG TPA: outer membrane protein transport protein [Solimonas sp.]|nr:outer membrane protein transport protein [Solimonas sp.]